MGTWTDIHAHLADERISADAEAVIVESRRRGVAGILVNAARVCEWDRVCELAAAPGVWGALGLHPFFAGDWHSGLADDLRERLCAGPRLAAIGEIGLDFYDGRENQARQEEVLARQLELARSLDLPVIVHNRKSWSEFFGLWRDTVEGSIPGVCHHFTGSREVARQALDKGLFLSFCGPLTYANARRLKEAARYVPLERILTETDTPDLPTASHRDEESRPWHVQEIVAEIARLKGMSTATVAGRVRETFDALVARPHP